jgi:hypothetical protein
MKIELLYFDDCPSWENALDHLKAVLADQGDHAEVNLIRVESDQAAQDHHFVGSPTIRIDGVDLFPTAHSNYGLGCRVYRTEEGMRGWPTPDMLRRAFSQLSSETG